jgi:polyisoprenoid-binding protein YceI
VAFRGVGRLHIAGVEREVTLDVTTERKDATLIVQGQVPLQMTDYGIKPPTAMLGMLKTDPKVIVTFETVLAIPIS